MILGAYNVQGVFLAKDNATVMKRKNFPPEADRKKMTDAFNANYPKEWIEIIKKQVIIERILSMEENFGL